MYSLPPGTIVVKDGIHKKVPGACGHLEPHLNLVLLKPFVSSPLSYVYRLRETHTPIHLYYVWNRQGLCQIGILGNLREWGTSDLDRP